jgi:dienelactone hydrolase
MTLRTSAFKCIVVPCLSAVVWLAAGSVEAQDKPPQVLPATQPLETEADITSELVDSVDRFLLEQLSHAPALREQRWPLPTEGKSLEQWTAATKELRERLRTIIGLRDPRVAKPGLVLEQEPYAENAYAEGEGWTAARARWPVLEGVDASGLWVQPRDRGQIKFRAVVIPDAGQTPEDLIGVSENAERCWPVAALLASAGGEVLVTTPISRHREARLGRAVMTDQEFLYRSAFELGRQALGYQVHETLAAVVVLDGLAAPPAAADAAEDSHPLPIVVVGWGEGGWVALHAAAVNDAIDATCVSGHFQPREQVWQEPIHHNIQGLLENFGDAELAALVAPAKLIIDSTPGPQVEIGGDGGAPGRLVGPERSATAGEFARAQSLLQPWGLEQHIQLVESDSPRDAEGPSAAAIAVCFATLELDVPLPEEAAATVRPGKALITPETRRQEMLAKWDRFSQRVLERAADERAAYWKSLKTDTLEDFQTTVEPYRKAFYDEVIGRWDLPLEEPNPRSRLVYDKPKFVGYEVVMDVFPGVPAYGVLLLPRDIPEGERRPCVVFQHGLEGRPQDCIEGDHPAYHDVAAQLAERGFVVFAPQNLYIFHDRFRTLQRKSNPLGKTLFSTIVPQHQQICHWLATQPQVDPSRIAFYGLSYGGKSAMRIPPLVPEYCLSICSADFNDWVWKNASTHSPYSYVWTMEYEIFEFDLGSRFNYAEMANLIAPRPFMVERGHFDGVAPDERVAAEFAKVRHMYSAKLGLGDDARIEWFVGPHTINGQGTYEFLHGKLNWPPKPVAGSR